MIHTKEAIITKNNDGTYKLEFPNVKLIDLEGNEINCKLVFPRTVTTDLIDKNGNIDRSKLLYSFEPEGDTIFTIEIQEENEQ